MNRKGPERPVRVTEERIREIASAIKNYFNNDRDDEMGDLASGLLLDLFMKNSTGFLHPR